MFTATKLGRMLTNLEELLLMMLLNPLRSLIKTIMSPPHDAYGHQTSQDCDLPWGSSIHKATWPFAHVVFRYHVTNLNHFISTKTMSIATKFSRMVTYLMGNIIITWSCEITWQTKIIVYPLPQCLWLSNLAGWVYIHCGASFHKVTRCFVTWFHKSCEILDLLHLNYDKAYGHQTWQCGNLL